MSKKNLIYWLMGISVLLIVLDTFGILKSVRNPIDNLISPVKLKIWNIKSGVGKYTDIVKNHAKYSQILEELAKLKQKQEESSLELKLLKEENVKLRLQLGAPLPLTFKLIPSNVLSVGLDMEVATGERDGVIKGMPVIDGLTLIGKVSFVSFGRSKIQLLSDINTKVSVKTNRGTSGDIIGGGNNSILLTKVLQKDPLFLDDKILTSGSDDFPPNLLIGKITHINSDDVSSYKQAKVEPLLDYASEQQVYIISK